MVSRGKFEDEFPLLVVIDEVGFGSKVENGERIRELLRKCEFGEIIQKVGISLLQINIL